MVSDLAQMNLAAISNRFSQIMKVLAMISTIILPMTLISGIYGINFALMPERDWALGYPFALALMAVSGICSFLFFRWKKWSLAAHHPPPAASRRATIDFHYRSTAGQPLSTYDSRKRGQDAPTSWRNTRPSLVVQADL